MNDHEHDADGNCITTEGFYSEALPTWKFSLWGVAGIVLGGAGGAVNAVANLLAYVGQECEAHANWKRQTYDIEEARRWNEAARKKMADDLQRLVGGDA